MKNYVVKTLAAMALAGTMVLTMAGCATNVKAETSGYNTTNGVTEGNWEVTTDDMGSASFNVEGNHVEMTNFAFDADESLQVEAEVMEDTLVYTQVYVHDENFDVKQNVADGHYPEIITQDNVVSVFNNLYQTIFGASDEPAAVDNIGLDRGVMILKINLTDGLMFMFAKEGTDQYIMVAVATEEFGSQDVVNAAFDALNAEGAAEATEDPIEDVAAVSAEDEVAPDEE